MMVFTEILWEVKTCKPFISMTHGKLFQEENNFILTGAEDGVVRVYEVPGRKTSMITSVRSLETKCGPVFHLQLHDIIRLVSQDLIAADSRGSVTLFCNGQIFMRTMPDKAAGITALQIHETMLGHLFIITGNEDGVVNCFNAFDNLWRIRLHDIMSMKIERLQSTRSVTCILATAISSSSCPAMDYIVVADSDKNLHFIQDGKVVISTSAPSVVKVMVAGYFLHFDEVGNPDEKLTQLALGCEDGTVWICVDFEVQTATQYANVGHTITHLHRLPPIQNSYSSTNGNKNDQHSDSVSEKLDLLLCCGQFPALLVLREGKVSTKHKLPDWTISICNFHQSDHDDANTVLIGCQDSTIQAIKVS
ncbi:uncharacterized protein LOC120342345 [Styela clava]|uniref:uncharacterized protein LOC120342345 n=1 Tax=Styela clava TaxID=7725 RepID=UPI00193A8DC7|nr:uncharacterized protein LOC120342345 [Styela clava]